MLGYFFHLAQQKLIMLNNKLLFFISYAVLLFSVKLANLCNFDKLVHNRVQHFAKLSYGSCCNLLGNIDLS